MKLLVVGHSLVIDANRKFWGRFAQKNSVHVDLVAPRLWKSNLNPCIPFKKNHETDSFIQTIFPIPVFFRGKGSFFFFNPFHIVSILSKEKYDAIYLNQETWALSTLFFLFAKLFTPNHSTKVFLCVAQNIKKDKFKFLHSYERFISKFVHAFLHCSQEVEDVLRWKGITNPSFYFPLPYDDETYHPSVRTQTQFTLGYLGRYTEDKGLLVLLAALDELNCEEIRFPLVIGGNGPLQNELTSRKYVTNLGLIPHVEAHRFYANIDCFVLPSETRPHWKEQFGRVITESFAAGRPVIGSSSGSIPEVLGKLQWNWIFKERSAEDLKIQITKMKDYLSSPEGKEALLRSIKLNQELFSQSEVALTLFQQLQKNP